MTEGRLGTSKQVTVRDDEGSSVDASDSLYCPEGLEQPSQYSDWSATSERIVQGVSTIVTIQKGKQKFKAVRGLANAHNPPHHTSFARQWERSDQFLACR